MLVVFNKTHFTLELGVEVVLTLRESVTLLLHSCAVALLSMTKAIVLNVVLSQAVVEGTFSMGRVVHETETTGVVRNVGITATSIVHVDNRFGVNVGKGFSRSFISSDKGSYNEQSVIKLSQSCLNELIFSTAMPQKNQFQNVSLPRSSTCLAEVIG